MKYRILIEQDEDGIFVAECPSLLGCISQGNSRKEVLENIQDAIKGYLESLRKHDEPVPPSIEKEIVEVASYNDTIVFVDFSICYNNTEYNEIVKIE